MSNQSSSSWAIQLGKDAALDMHELGEAGQSQDARFYEEITDPV